MIRNPSLLKNTSKTFWTMCLAFRPATSYIFSGVSWSIKVSGSIIDLNLSPLSKIPFSANKFATCEPNPPIEPSSIVISTSWFSADFKINFSSNGFANLASIIVVEIPLFFNSLAAILHSSNLVPKKSLLWCVYFAWWAIIIRDLLQFY